MGAKVAAQGTKAPSWKGYDQWKRKKLDPLTERWQAEGGRVSGAAYRTVEQVPNQLAKTGKEIGDFINRVTGQGGDSGGGDDNKTSSMNYSKKASGSKGSKQGTLKKKDRKTTGSKRQFYATKQK